MRWSCRYLLHNFSLKPLIKQTADRMEFLPLGNIQAQYVIDTESGCVDISVEVPGPFPVGSVVQGTVKS